MAGKSAHVMDYRRGDVSLVFSLLLEESNPGNIHHQLNAKPSNLKQVITVKQ